MHVTPIRRKYLLRLLAQVDQLIAESKSLASSPLLNERERQIAAEQLDFGRDAAERVESMLGNLRRRE